MSTIFVCLSFIAIDQQLNLCILSCQSLRSKPRLCTNTSKLVIKINSGVFVDLADLLAVLKCVRNSGSILTWMTIHLLPQPRKGRWKSVVFWCGFRLLLSASGYSEVHTILAGGIQLSISCWFYRWLVRFLDQLGWIDSAFRMDFMASDLTDWYVMNLDLPCGTKFLRQFIFADWWFFLAIRTDWLVLAWLRKIKLMMPTHLQFMILQRAYIFYT